MELDLSVHTLCVMWNLLNPSLIILTWQSFPLLQYRIGGCENIYDYNMHIDFCLSIVCEKYGTQKNLKCIDLMGMKVRSIASNAEEGALKMGI